MDFFFSEPPSFIFLFFFHLDILFAYTANHPNLYRLDSSFFSLLHICTGYRYSDTTGRHAEVKKEHAMQYAGDDAAQQEAK